MSAFPVPQPALRRLAGNAPVVLIAPHATSPLAAAQPFVDGHPEVQAELAERVADWHDEGSAEALEAAARALGATGLRPQLPRGLVDLNRGWKGRVEAKETLFGKGALDQWAQTHLLPGAQAALESYYRSAIGELSGAAVGVRGVVEVHSYGDLGSTYDLRAGGRPVRRPEAAVVTPTPWATAYPVGLARLIPGDLRGTPWALERRVGDALAARGFGVGPSPYPSQGPWAVSQRFLASRWFHWLGRTGQIDPALAEVLVAHAWSDEQDPALDAAASGEGGEPAELAGVRDLARKMCDWSHAPGDLGQRFLAETGVFTLVVELRVDRVARAEAFGLAVADALREYLR